MIDITSIIAIAVAIVLAYLLIKFIISPIIKIIIGIIIFLIIIYVLQRFFGIDFGIYLDKWNINLDWILKPLNYYADKIKNLFNFVWQNVPKSQ